MTDLLPNPFIEPGDRFVLDEAAFMAAIDPESSILSHPPLPQQENADV